MSKWISVKDEPVPMMKKVLIANKYQVAAGCIFPSCGARKNIPTDYYAESPFESPITHWQLFPALPEL